MLQKVSEKRELLIFFQIWDYKTGTDILIIFTGDTSNGSYSILFMLMQH